MTDSEKIAIFKKAIKQESNSTKWKTIKETEIKEHKIKYIDDYGLRIYEFIIDPN